MTIEDDKRPGSRERILSAALTCFGRDGLGATVRTIAAEAGVSAALVIHHFADKAGLRRACDEVALHALAHKPAAVDAAQREEVAEHLVAPVRYAARVLVGGGDDAQAYFDTLLAAARRETERIEPADTPASHADAAAVALTTYSLAPLLLAPVLARHYGRAHVDADILLRLRDGLQAVAPLLLLGSEPR
ncbi:helix-turn-helix domain-containing protein [Microbacterium sp. HA-8]|uniref:helix-turn-helix domain-containing protein n=1 Tax=Microbacterium sp. HA-8 TaxID=3234200 RepID=UPI0038F7D833